MSEKKHDWRSALDEVVRDKRRERGSHPDHATLVDYHSGRLPPEAEKQVRHHLVLCRRCAKLLLEFDAFTAEAADPSQESSPPGDESKPKRRWWWTPLAAAAVLLLIVLAWPSADPLPIYTGRLSGQVQPTRDADSDQGDMAVHVFPSGGRLVLRLQPQTALQEMPTARAYLRHDGDLRALSASVVEVRRDGVVSLEGELGTDLILPQGRSELIVVVARPAWLPSRARLDRGEDSGDPRWTSVRRTLQVTPPGADAPSPTDLQRLVEYSGCLDVLSGPVCLLDEDRRLTLWVRHERRGEINIHAGTWRESYRATPVGNGLRFQIEVGSVEEVAVEILSGERRLIWVLEVRSQRAADSLDRARRLYQAGEAVKAGQLLTAHLERADPAQAGPALSLMARIERSLGRPRISEDYYRRALQSHRSAGRLSQQVRDACGLTFYLIQERRFAEGRRLLASLPVAATGGDVRSRYFQAYYRGLLAEESGDLRTARKGMLQAVRAARHGGLVTEEHFADDILARQLAFGGLFEAAEVIYQRRQPFLSAQCRKEPSGTVFSACDCARFAVNRAWVRLLAAESGQAEDGLDPGILLREAERLLTRDEVEDCRRPDDLANLRLNLSLAALLAGHPEEARHHLTEAAIDPRVHPRLALWQLDVEARLALTAGDAQNALEIYRRLGRLAELSASPEAAWRAAFRRAEVLQWAGETEQALAACRQAEHLLEKEMVLVPLDEGRAMFIAQRDKASRLCLDVLLKAGRRQEALAYISRSASRALKSLPADARFFNMTPSQHHEWDKLRDSYQQTRSEIEALAAQIWKGLPLDQERRLEKQLQGKRNASRKLLDGLAWMGTGEGRTGGGLAPNRERAAQVLDKNAPRTRALGQIQEGTLLLAYHPLPQGWAAMAWDGKEAAFRAIETLPPSDDLEALASALLQPFAARLERASEVWVIASGPVRAVDFHALPFGPGILLEHAPVVYHLGLPPPVPGNGSGLTALVVAGPGLLEASSEAEEVSQILGTKLTGQAVRTLRGNQARGSVVRKELTRASLFHYAGHAQYDHDSRGWDSHLALPDGGRLTVDDILASPRVPRYAVLSGCDTGRDSDGASVPNIGLAQAFLAAGSETVVAATARVSDAGAAALGASLYRHWEGPPDSLAQALRKAQLELRQENPESDWRSFRALAR